MPVEATGGTIIYGIWRGQVVLERGDGHVAGDQGPDFLHSKDAGSKDFLFGGKVLDTAVGTPRT